MFAGGGATRHRSAPGDAVLEMDVDFDGGIAAAIEDLARSDVLNGRHVSRDS